MKKNIVVVGYPKSGNTWLTRLVAQLVNCPVEGFWGQPEDEEIAAEGDGRESDFSVFKAHGIPSQLRRVPKKIFRLIYVVRDPRDVAVSGSYYFQKFADETAQNNFVPMVNAVCGGEGGEANCWLKVSWATHVAAYIGHPKEVLIVRYEDLLQRGEMVLDGIAHWIGISRTAEEIQAALSAQSFSLRKADAVARNDEKNLRMFRSGTVGEFRKHLSDAQISRVEQTCGEMMQRLGYAFESQGHPVISSTDSPEAVNAPRGAGRAGMVPSARVVRMFWHGGPLSVYERLSVKSFVKQGMPVEVFSFDRIDLPAGAVWRDAAEILPRSSLFTYRAGPGAGSVSAFSNLFRYKMLYELGGIWSDCDVLCLRPLHELPEAFVGKSDTQKINTALMGLPPRSRICKELYEHALAVGKDAFWGEIGPDLLTALIASGRFPEVTILPPQAFYPVPWQKAALLASPKTLEGCEKAASHSFCVHWWNEIFRRVGIPKDKLPPPGSFLAERAADVFENEKLENWDPRLVMTWINNYRDAHIYRQKISGKP